MRLQVLISTGKADWGSLIATDTSSLAYHLSFIWTPWLKSAGHNHTHSPSEEEENETTRVEAASSTNSNIRGVLSYASTSSLSVLNGSHTSQADDPDTHDTVLILPDFVAVVNVPRSAEGAQALYKHALDPSVKRAGTNIYVKGEDPVVDELRTWTLPYNCLVMLCE